MQSPKQVIVVDSVPVTALGKPDKKAYARSSGRAQAARSADFSARACASSYANSRRVAVRLARSRWRVSNQQNKSVVHSCSRSHADNDSNTYALHHRRRRHRRFGYCRSADRRQQGTGPRSGGGVSTPLPEIAVPPAWPTLVDTAWNWGDSTAVQSATGTASARPRTRCRRLIRHQRNAVRPRTSGQLRRVGAGGREGLELRPATAVFQAKRIVSSREPPCGCRRTTRGGAGRSPGELFDACLSAALECGHPRAADISGGEDVGFGPVDLNIVDGKRQSAADAYLNPALQRPNLELAADATVHRLLIEHGRCVGVEYSADGAGSVSRALAGEVILAAGTIGSAQLLMLSGVGPASHLRDVGLDVALDLPGVGANLHDHPVVDLVYRPARPIPAARNNHGELLGLFCSEKADAAPDLQVLFIDSIGGNLLGTDGMTDGYTLAVAVMQPFSRGTLRLSGPTAGDR